MSLPSRVREIGTFAVLLGALSCQATEPAANAVQVESKAEKSAPPSAVQPAAPEAPEAPVAELSTADLEFQKLLASMGVHFFPKEKLEISGWVNMQSGLVEVFACAPQGKTHEAVVVLDCVPSGLQAGLIALGLEPGTPVEFGTGDAYKPPTGAPVEIQVRWKDADGKECTAYAEDWVWDEKHKAPMPRGPWLFAGSFLQPGPTETDTATFAADYVKSLATTYHDASSILETSQIDGIDDTVYFSNEKAVPPVKTPITAIFRPAKK